MTTFHNGFGFHEPVHLMNAAGYVADPFATLAAMGGGPARVPWYYTLRHNPANFKPPIFEGYPSNYVITQPEY